MLWFIFILVLVVFILIMIPLLSVQIAFSTILSSSAININIKGTTFFGLLHFQKEWSLADILSIEREEIEELEEDPVHFATLLNELKYLPQNIKPFQRVITQFFKKIKIKQFEWRTTIGLGDAAETGTASGAIWSLKGTVFSWARNYLSFAKKPLIDVHPDYQRMTLETTCQCMMQIKVGNAIWTAYKIAREWKKHKKRSFSQSEKDRRTINV
ncbi:DUF2953 domain-containing protein [Bacillus sp. SD088]|uniref:DUF2953 domain-containing protein n=1 Tax=Bacillus sp. SD088 TaxID=2782012 RepID=UPI001A97C3BC|nr:DUF2953 domain-containing protein [Bacillus sp. SD088]MBO0992348.1 DUF2953 domain-containing protein [Bacillus sp. SD088]